MLFELRNFACESAASKMTWSCEIEMCNWVTVPLKLLQLKWHEQVSSCQCKSDTEVTYICKQEESYKKDNSAL